MLSLTEENYLKAIYHLSIEGSKGVLTNEIAEAMKTKAASVTDMIKKLASKNFISYERYYGVKMTRQGKGEAALIIRKHRLWETFLVQKLKFSWDEVHEIAEQLEHIHSPLLIEKLDEFLGYPVTDPHGEPIPDNHGKVNATARKPLCDVAVPYEGVIASVRDSDASLLKYLMKIGALPGTRLKVLAKEEYDGSLDIVIGENRTTLSHTVARNILITL